MQKEIIRLWPRRQKFKRVRGLYLRKDLHRSSAGQGPTVYADFLSSLDGRIAVKQNGRDALPEQLTSSDDFRLLMELQAQADCIVTHSGYLRERAAGRLGDVLHVGTAKGHADLVAWRRRRGLHAQPLVVVCSASLDFPPPTDLPADRVWVVSGAGADPKRVKALRDLGYRMLTAGKRRTVDGAALMKRLRAARLKSVFLLAGPTLFESLVAARAVEHIFLTYSHQFVGTPDFHTMLPGGMTLPDCRLTQKELLYINDGSHAQWLAHFQCAYPS